MAGAIVSGAIESASSKAPGLVIVEPFGGSVAGAFP